MRAAAPFAFLCVLGCAAAPPHSALAESKQAHARTCVTSNDCTLVPRSCCGHCGQASSGDVRAVLAESAATPGRCVGTECPHCHDDPDPALVAYCASGTCHALDLHTSAITHCTQDADCIVRPQGCCECGAHAWVAVNASRSDAYARRVCPRLVQCTQCVGPFPPVVAVCRSAHCELAPRR